jgi:hypothetical protein
MERKYIVVDPFTSRPFIFKSKESALEEAIKMHNASAHHPSFMLYQTDVHGRGVYIGRLMRDFGTDNLHWGSFDPAIQTIVF